MPWREPPPLRCWAWPPGAPLQGGPVARASGFLPQGRFKGQQRLSSRGGAEALSKDAALEGGGGSPRALQGDGPSRSGPRQPWPGKTLLCLERCRAAACLSRPHRCLPPPTMGAGKQLPEFSRRLCLASPPVPGSLWRRSEGSGHPLCGYPGPAASSPLPLPGCAGEAAHAGALPSTAVP